MYDPQTVAHDIGRLVTIWHRDPERTDRGNRSDDSCGWFTPPSTQEHRDRIDKLGRSEWPWLFRQREQLARGDPEKYAYICYEPTTYDAIYWAWRRIKREARRDAVWNYGRERGGYLTPGELEYIYHLASSPVDNLQSTVREVKDAETCGDFFRLVDNAYRRYHRPWWRHPRWHVHHWKFQVHSVQQFKRWAFSRCCRCGGRFTWGYAPTTDCWEGTGPLWFRSERLVYHSDCKRPKDSGADTVDKKKGGNLSAAPSVH